MGNIQFLIKPMTFISGTKLQIAKLRIIHEKVVTLQHEKI